MIRDGALLITHGLADGDVDHESKATSNIAVDDTEEHDDRDVQIETVEGQD